MRVCESEQVVRDYDGQAVGIQCIHRGYHTVWIKEEWNPEPPHEPYWYSITLCDAHLKEYMDEAQEHMARFQCCPSCGGQRTQRTDLGIIVHDVKCGVLKYGNMLQPSFDDSAMKRKRVDGWLEFGLELAIIFMVLAIMVELTKRGGW